MAPKNWPALVAAYRSSGLSRNDFAKLHKLKPSTLAYHIARNNNGHTRVSPKKPLFTEVGAPTQMEIQKGDLVLRLPVSTSPEQLKSIIKAFSND